MASEEMRYLVLDLGGVTVEWLGAERLHMDAGAMFGPVPKLLWEGKYPAGADNLAPFVATPLLIRTKGRCVLVDTGLGNRLTPKQLRNFKVEYSETVPRGLQRKGLTGEQIDMVILTHMDWDHAAGIVEADSAEALGLGATGSERLRYPKALHIINALEWHDANHPNVRSKNTYWRDNWALLEREGSVRLVHGDEEVVEGVWVHHTGGHTRGHMMIEIRGDEGTAYHLADILPTHAHLNPLWVTAYDNFPLDSVAQKALWLDRAAEQGAWLLFYHDALYTAIRLNSKGEITEYLKR